MKAIQAAALWEHELTTLSVEEIPIRFPGFIQEVESRSLSDAESSGRVVHHFNFSTIDRVLLLAYDQRTFIEFFHDTRNLDLLRRNWWLRSHIFLGKDRKDPETWSLKMEVGHTPNGVVYREVKTKDDILKQLAENFPVAHPAAAADSLLRYCPRVIAMFTTYRYTPREWKDDNWNFWIDYSIVEEDLVYGSITTERSSSEGVNNITYGLAPIIIALSINAESDIVEACNPLLAKDAIEMCLQCDVQSTFGDIGRRA